MNEQEKNTSKVKKIVRIALDVVWGIFLVLIATFAISNVAAKKNDGIPAVFGTGYLTVLSPSMDGDHEDSFKVGDLIIVDKVGKNENPTNLKAGDIITYVDDVMGNDELVTHRIYEARKEGDLTVYYTLGDMYADDPKFSSYETLEDWQNAGGTYIKRVSSTQVLAVYKGKRTGVGTVIAWFQGSLGFFVIVVLPTLIFLIVELIQFIKTLGEYKKESNKKSEEEIAAERAALKAQLLAELKAEALKQAQEEQKAQD